MFDEPRRPVVADAQFALDEGNGGAAGFDDDFDRLVVERVVFTRFFIVVAGGDPFHFAFVLLAKVGDVFPIFGLRANALDDAVDFAVGDKGAVQTLGDAHARRQK